MAMNSEVPSLEKRAEDEGAVVLRRFRKDGAFTPEDWEPVPLWKLGRCLSGGTPRTSDPRFWGDDLPWVSSKDMKVSRLSDAIDHVTHLAIGNGTRLIPPGTILMVVRGMSLAHSFPVAITERPMTFNQDLKAFVPRPSVNGEFLLRWLAANETSILQVATDSTHGTKRIPTDDLLRTEIPLPSVPEQRRIAEVLSNVDELLTALDALISKKRAIKTGTMQQLLTGKTRLPGFSGEWKTKRLGDHVTFLRHGVNSRAELITDGPVKYLHYGDIHTRAKVYLDPGASPLPSIPGSRAGTLDRLQDGDLIIVDASEDLEGVGKSVEIKNIQSEEVVSGLHTIAARFDKAVLADGFKAYLQFCSTFRNQLRRLAAGTKVYATNRAHVASVELPLPSTDEQNAITTVLADMDAEIAALEARRDKTRAIKHGMMQQLLTGRIRLVKPKPVEDIA